MNEQLSATQAVRYSRTTTFRGPGMIRHASQPPSIPPNPYAPSDRLERLCAPHTKTNLLPALCFRLAPWLAWRVTRAIDQRGIPHEPFEESWLGVCLWAARPTWTTVGPARLLAEGLAGAVDPSQLRRGRRTRSVLAARRRGERAGCLVIRRMSLGR